MNAPVANESFVLEVEQEVLGALLLGTDVRRISSFLQERHFVEPLHGVLYAAILQAHERYNSTTAPVVLQLLPNDADMAFKVRAGVTVNAYVSSLIANTVLGPAGLDKTARKIVEQWARVALIDEAARLSAAASDPSTNPVELVASIGQTFDDIISEVRAGASRRSRTSIAKAADNALVSAKDARQRGSGLTGLTWGLSDVNRLTGGIQKRDLTLIAARPSMGKTTVGLNVGVSVAKAGHGVGFISLEMDADKLAARAISDLAFDWRVRVPYADIIRGDVTDEQLEQVREASKSVEQMPLWIEEQPNLSMAEIRVKAEAIMQQAEQACMPLEVLIVDHLGLIRPSSRYMGNRTNEVGEISAGLKAFAREYGIAVIALSQLSRALETRNDKRPQMSDLRDSGAIEQDADTIVFLYRESYYLEREKGGSADAVAERTEKLIDSQNRLDFDIAKQRNGPVRNIELFVDMACSAVRNGAGR